MKGPKIHLPTKQVIDIPAEDLTEIVKEYVEKFDYELSSDFCIHQGLIVELEKDAHSKWYSKLWVF